MVKKKKKKVIGWNHFDFSKPKSDNIFFYKCFVIWPRAFEHLIILMTRYLEWNSKISFEDLSSLSHLLFLNTRMLILYFVYSDILIYEIKKVTEGKFINSVR